MYKNTFWCVQPVVPCIHSLLEGSEEEELYRPDRERLTSWRSHNTASPAELWTNLFRFYRFLFKYYRYWCRYFFKKIQVSNLPKSCFGF
jgi:hypothetical protein